MYYKSQEKALFTESGQRIKALSCPYEKTPSLHYKSQRVLRCHNCSHPVLLAHTFSEAELVQQLKHNPETCLAVDGRFVRFES